MRSGPRYVKNLRGLQQSAKERTPKQDKPPSLRKQRAEQLRAFLDNLARMTKDDETKGGMSSDDAVSTLHQLIEDARALTGIDPQHQKFCECCLEKPVAKAGDWCADCNGSKPGRESHKP